LHFSVVTIEEVEKVNSKTYDALIKQQAIKIYKKYIHSLWFYVRYVIIVTLFVIAVKIDQRLFSLIK